MITFRSNEEEKRVAELASILGLDKSEVLRRAVNHHYAIYQNEFTAYDWPSERLDQLPGSGRSDASSRRMEYLDDIYAARTNHRR